MVLVGRVLAIAKRGLLFQAKFHTTTSVTSSSTTNPPPHPLLLKLLQESNSRIKPTLDLETNLTPNDDLIVWERLLSLLRSSSPPKVQLVLEWKLEKLLKANERDQARYSDLIHLCGKVQNVQFALQVFSTMEAHGVKPTSSVFNSLISACSSSNNIITALSLFEIMQKSEDYKPNAVTYNSFISIYSKLGDSAPMQAWYSASKKAGFPPTVQTFEFLIAGCIKCQEIDTAQMFCEDMTLSGITPNISILENLLEGICQGKNLGKVKDFLKFVLDGGWNINENMVKKLLGLYHSVGKVEEMEELLLTITSKNQDPEVISHLHCGIIRMYALSDRLDDLEFSIGRMLKQGMSFTCQDDVDKVICSYFRRAAYERLDLFLERIRGSYKLTRSSYDLLVAGYRRAGSSERLESVMEEMKLIGFSVSEGENC